MSSTPRKRPSDENQEPKGSTRHLASNPLIATPSQLTFVDGFTPVPKKRRVARPLGAEDINNIQAVHALRLQVEKTKKDEDREKEMERTKREYDDKKLDMVLGAVKAAGFSLYTFLLAIFNTRNQHRSSQVSQMLKYHGSELFTAMATRQPGVAHDWMLSSIRQKVAAEASALTRYFRPEQHTPVHEILARFSLTDVLHDAEMLAPTIYDIFQHVGLPDGQPTDTNRRKCNHVRVALVLSVSMLI